MRRVNAIAAAALAAVAALTAVMSADAAKTGAVTQYNLPAPRGPYSIAVGSDGNLWFGIITPCCDTPKFDIGMLTPSGQFTGFNTPTPNPGITGITRGPDGNVWFAEFFQAQIGVITPQGAVTEYPVQVQTVNGPQPVSPASITLGPDGALWFTAPNQHFIGRIDLGGGITLFNPPDPSSVPQVITAGPDGALWFTDVGTGTIGRITTAGDMTSFPLPLQSQGSELGGLATGPDGNIWFVDAVANLVGRMTLTGKVTEFPVQSHNGRPDAPGSIAAGPDGALWFTFTSIFAPGVGRITTGGKLTEFSTPNISGGTGPGITAGPPSVPHSVWFTQQTANDVDKITTR